MRRDYTPCGCNQYRMLLVVDPALACFWSRGVMLRAARYARRGRWSEFAGEVETDVLEVVLRHL